MSDAKDYAILKQFKDQESNLGGRPPGVLRHDSPSVLQARQAKLDDLCDAGYLKAIDPDWAPEEKPDPTPTPWTEETLDELTMEQIQVLVHGIDVNKELTGNKSDFIAQALEVLAEA